MSVSVAYLFEALSEAWNKQGLNEVVPNGLFKDISDSGVDTNYCIYKHTGTVPTGHSRSGAATGTQYNQTMLTFSLYANSSGGVQNLAKAVLPKLAYVLLELSQTLGSVLKVYPAGETDMREDESLWRWDLPFVIDWAHPVDVGS